MLFNKNNYRKTGDKKVLHKVGKQWKVVSVALLMAIGGAAVATHANAHASVANSNDNADVNSTVQSLETPLAANGIRVPASAQPAKSASAQPSVKQNVSYYPGSNGSAASYFDKADTEEARANANYGTVNAYVQSLNAEYNPEVSSFAAKSASANSNGSADSKLAQSYSATANNGNTVNVINSLAAKNHMNPTLYQGMVQNQEQAFSGAVSGASNDVNAANFVNSVVNKFENTDLSAASLNASESATTAYSDYLGAVANFYSVSAYYGDINSGAGFYVDVADKLSQGANTLLANGNPSNYNANLGLAKDYYNNDTNNTENSYINSAFTSAVNYAVSSAKSEFANITAKNSNSLSNYANGNNYAGYEFNSLTDVNANGSNPFNVNNTLTNTPDALSDFNQAVSAATDYQFSPYLASVANSLYGQYSPSLANYRTRSAAKSDAEQSASDEVRAASFANDFAYANYGILSNLNSAVSDAVLHSGVNSKEATASVAASLLSQSLGTTKDQLANDVEGVDDATNAYGPEINGRNYFEAVKKALGADNPANTAAVDAYKLAEDVYSRSYIPNVETGAFVVSPYDQKVTKNDVSANLAKVANVVNDVKNELGSIANYPENNYNDFTNTTLGNLNEGTLSKDFNAANANKIPSLRAVFANHETGNNPDVLNDLLDAAFSKANEPTIVTTAAGNKQYSHLYAAAYNAIADNTYGVKDQGQNTPLSTIVTDLNNVSSNLQAAADAASSIEPTYHDDITKNDNYMPYGLEGNFGIDASGLSATTSANAYAHTLASAALLSDGIDLDKLNSGAYSDVNSAASSAAASDTTANVTPETSTERLNNALSVAASSADSALTAAQNASASNSASNDDGVVLASYFASSYTSDASNAYNDAQNTSAELNSFFKYMASDATFNSADDAYSTNETAAENDYKLGVGNAKAVYNDSPHFLNVLKGAAIHTTPNFGSKDDKVTSRISKGDRLSVYGVNVSRNNFKRGVIRYYVLDNTTGKKGFVTGQPQFTTAAYLNATAENADVTVKTLKPVNVYNEINGKKVVTSLKAGTVLDNVTVVPDNGTNDAEGFTKIETPSDQFFTANVDYVEVLRPTVNNNNNNNNYTPSSFDLNKFNANAPYYNDKSGFNFKA